MKSLKEQFERFCKYKISKDTKQLPRYALEDYYESLQYSNMMQLDCIEEILFAIRKGEVKDVLEIAQYIEENTEYMIVPYKVDYVADED